MKFVPQERKVVTESTLGRVGEGDKIKKKSRLFPKWDA